MSFLAYADQLIAQLNPVQGTYNQYSIGINKSLPKTAYGIFKTAKVLLTPKKAAFSEYLRLRGGRTPNYAKYIGYQKDKFASSSHRANTSRRHNPITGISTMPARIGYSGSKRRAPMSSRTRGRNLRQRIRTAQRGHLRQAGYYALQPGEKKFFDVTSTLATIVSTGTIVEDSLNHITQGTGESQRVGRVAWVKSMHVRGVFIIDNGLSVSGVNRHDSVRCIWYLDRQCNGATATVAQILDSADINSHLNLENSSRFHILKEILIGISSGPGAGDIGGANSNFVGSETPFKFNLKFKSPIKIEFNGADGTIDEIRSNNIGFLVISRLSITPSNLETCNRIRYTD